MYVLCLIYKNAPGISNNDSACIYQYYYYFKFLCERDWIICTLILLIVANRGHRNEGDSVNDKYNMELLAILKQESKQNPEFETYCSAFEDPYGDQYDWEEDIVTQRYVCWMLNTHYNQQVVTVWTLLLNYFKN